MYILILIITLIIGLVIVILLYKPCLGNIGRGKSELHVANSCEDFLLAVGLSPNVVPDLPN